LTFREKYYIVAITTNLIVKIMTDFRLNQSLGYLINRTARRLKHELQQAFKTHGYDVTPEQWALLNLLWEKEGLSQVELADQTFKDKPNVTRMLDVLERKQLLFRQRDEADRRAFKVYLTEEGRSLKDKLVPLAIEILKRGQKNLTNEDLTYLREKLNTIYNNFE
jgi:DNA-binding MarR family transcriptional regulator